MNECRKSDNSGSPVGGIIILGIGLYWLAMNSGWLPWVDESWPAFLVIVGVALIFGGFRAKNRSASEGD